MAEYILHRRLTIDRPRAEVFRFFTDARNLQEMCPRELDFTLLTPQPIEIKKGTIIDYRLKLRGFPIHWKTLISAWNPPYSFIDESIKGPYKQWVHEHILNENGDAGTDIEDIIRYRLPLEPFGDLAHCLVRCELNHIFDYRQKAIVRMMG